ncbi:Protein Mpv17 [Gracilariopsis chorda]|uniref:Protein Mpv17 n=1 Tax=Gracilariopsis chorda TaxID=448386 RepID=A0A2V3J3C5_9FLOR|nr:Protein Mpv17 [Gracilariopsis chorda]|eukprot:PXF48497.1 Protein Mpv17 [Gracilariopsis chorda]
MATDEEVRIPILVDKPGLDRSSSCSTFATLNDNGSCFNPQRAYVRMLDKYPLVTKMLTSGVLVAISDLIAQLVEARGYIWVQRTIAFSVAEIVFSAPLLHVLYELYERYIPAVNLRNLLSQLVLDGVVAMPVWLFVFLVLVSILEGRWTLVEIWETLRTKYIPSLIVTLILTPVVQSVNFTVVPPKYRVLVVNIVDLVYTTILSLLAHRSGDG